MHKDMVLGAPTTSRIRASLSVFGRCEWQAHWSVKSATQSEAASCTVYCAAWAHGIVHRMLPKIAALLPFQHRLYRLGTDGPASLPGALASATLEPDPASTVPGTNSRGFPDRNPRSTVSLGFDMARCVRLIQTIQMSASGLASTFTEDVP